ncbi:MAG: diaminopimelate epimerase, partial [Altererythrobacter sp.]|nr:diaminopimelate epimerase [Altererythrobacter sp.]
MRVDFTKMHGLGNDFVILDGRKDAMPALDGVTAAAIADRRKGIGCDQLILLENCAEPDADFRMRIFNSDGGEVEACGNAARAVALLHGVPAKVLT